MLIAQGTELQLSPPQLSAVSYQQPALIQWQSRANNSPKLRFGSAIGVTCFWWPPEMGGSSEGLFSLQLLAKEAPQFLTGVLGTHKHLSNEERVNAVGQH